MNIKHIVVTTDLSDESFRPCEPVSELARANGARVTLLHVVRVLRVAPHGAPLAPPLTPPDTEKQLAKAREKLEEQRARLDIEAAVDVVASDDVPTAVHAWARDHGADLVAVSTHGHTGFRRLALGSVAEAILRHSDVPVLVFPRSKE